MNIKVYLYVYQFQLVQHHHYAYQNNLQNNDINTPKIQNNVNTNLLFINSHFIRFYFNFLFYKN